MIRSLAVKYPDQSIIALGHKLLGPFGKIGTPVWLMLVFLLTALLAKRVTDEVSTIILFRTPGLVSTLAFLLLVCYMALLGEEALGRLSSVMVVMLPVFLLLLMYEFPSGNLFKHSSCQYLSRFGVLAKMGTLVDYFYSHLDFKFF